MSDLRRFIDEQDPLRKAAQLVEAVKARLPDLDGYIAHALASKDRVVCDYGLASLLILDRVDELRDAIRRELSQTDTVLSRVAACLSMVPAVTTEADRSLVNLPLEYLAHSDPHVGFAALEATRILVQAGHVNADVPSAFCAAHYDSFGKNSRLECLHILLASTADIRPLIPSLRAEAAGADWCLADLARECLVQRFT